MASADAKPEMAAEHAPSLAKVGQFGAVPEGRLQTVADEYNSFFDKSKPDAGASQRVTGYKTMVNHYYDLVTDFYEYVQGR